MINNFYATFLYAFIIYKCPTIHNCHVENLMLHACDIKFILCISVCTAKINLPWILS